MESRKRPDYLKLAWSDEEAWNRKLIQLATGPDNNAFAEFVERLRHRAKLSLCDGDQSADSRDERGS